MDYMKLRKQVEMMQEELVGAPQLFPVLYINNWNDPAVKDFRGVALLQVADGISYHVRLGLLIVDKSEFDKRSVANHLPGWSRAGHSEEPPPQS